jgi:hypothetical protein
MIDSRITFPIWKNDGKAIEPLNDLQKKQINIFLNKIKNNEYKFIDNPCLCGNTDKSLDILVAEKDRYGIPCNNVLCKKCGLIRLKERLDDYSTAEFYNNEYRDIYVGEEVASDKFFADQSIRGASFLTLVKSHVNFDEIKTVFEVGCGAGGILYPFYEMNKQVSGCDFGEKYLKFGQDKGLDLYQGEISLEKTPTNSQDLIILSHVMEHFNEPLKTMSDIIEFITPEKYLLVEVPGIFDIQKTYFNPILYFQNAHVHNYYYYYLKVFFEALGLEVIYGDERCTFLLKKPTNWTKRRNIIISDLELEKWSAKVECELIKCTSATIEANKLGITARLKMQNLEFSKSFNIIFEQIMELKQSSGKYYIYGAGTVGQMVAGLIPNQILGFIDNDPTKIGTFISGIEVFSSQYLSLQNNYDKVIISVLGREEMVSMFLIQDLQVLPYKIKFFNLDCNQNNLEGFKHHKYYELISKNIELKDIHKGKRCFILGSGPSIEKEDLKVLKNEIVFALNNFYVHEDFAEIMSGDVEKYYMTAPTHPPQTEDEWKRWFEDMEKHMPKDTKMLFGLNSYGGNIKYIFEKYGIFKGHKIHWYFAGVNLTKGYIFDEKDVDFSNPIWSASTVSTYALLLAAYMGFKEIYLLGVDHNYICLQKEESYRFYRSAVHQENEHGRMKLKKSVEFEGTAKVFLEKELIADNCLESTIFNCSEDSLLNMFEKKSLGEVIK